MRFEFPSNINSNYEGYTALIDFYTSTQNLVFDQIILDLNKTTWFEANLTAVLGAILNKAQANLNDVRIENLSEKIKKLFSRNHFLSHFGGLKIPDYYETTTKYRKFKTSEETLFKEYLDIELLSKKAMPDMSLLLRKKINESIFEVFSNTVIHGHCDNIFSCGQFYPRDNRLDFTIVDLGNTIKENVNNYSNKQLTGEESIKWAVKKGHTTKQGRIPGGLGLHLIREFLKKNNGKIQIVSSDGLWEQNGSNTNSETFSKSFPGTIVNIEFNIEDTKFYYLLSEIDKQNIF